MKGILALAVGLLAAQGAWATEGENGPNAMQPIRELAKQCMAQEHNEPEKWNAASDSFKLYCYQARLQVTTELAEHLLKAYQELKTACAPE